MSDLMALFIGIWVGMMIMILLFIARVFLNKS